MLFLSWKIPKIPENSLILERWKPWLDHSLFLCLLLCFTFMFFPLVFDLLHHILLFLFSLSLIFVCLFVFFILFSHSTPCSLPVPCSCSVSCLFFQFSFQFNISFLFFLILLFSVTQIFHWKFWNKSSIFNSGACPLFYTKLFSLWLFVCCQIKVLNLFCFSIQVKYTSKSK